ncbi:hypothetical protein VTJ04DRAFT_8108 [Mycothermus thermophilus]|uniref:uncharacterized protein n=1 Tax=Humicola insolens TaxID=85995 RepID=UPI00374420AD
MADHPAHSAFNRHEGGNPAEDPNLPQHLYDRVSNLIVDDGSRADSPTDAVMPLMRRPAPSQEPANSPDPSNDNNFPGPNNHTILTTHDQRAENQSASESGASAMATPESSSSPHAAATFNFSPEAAPPAPAGIRLRIAPELRQMVIPTVFVNDTILSNEIDIHGPKICRWMEGLCQISANMDPKKVDWRKAMSHVFGRNKNCTRSIPEACWLFMCRKHYQRGRYRNGHEYNVKLTTLVITQVLRLEAWSNFNQDTGAPENGVITDYTLSPRRREQIRLQNQNRRKRRPAANEESDEESGSDSDSDVDVGEATVPRWLELACRPGKTAAEIMQILMRILNEIRANIMPHFPDIEILPTITGDRAKPNNKKRAKTRRSANASRESSAIAPQTGSGSRSRRGRSSGGSGATSPAGPILGGPIPGTHLAYRPNPITPNPTPFIGGPYAPYGTTADMQHAPYPPMNNWPGPVPQAPGPHDFTRGHRVTRSYDANAFGQAHLGYHMNTPTSEPFSSYAQYPVTTRDRTVRTPQNGYWDDRYDERQRAIWQQPTPHTQPATGISNTGYNFSTPTTNPTGAPLGGRPPANVAKHTKSQSMPASMMAIAASRGSHPQTSMAPPSSMAPTSSMTPPAQTQPSPMYGGQPESRYSYGSSSNIPGIGPSLTNMNDSMTRATEYDNNQRQPPAADYAEPRYVVPRFADARYAPQNQHNQTMGGQQENVGSMAPSNQYDQYQQAPPRH